MWPNSLWLIALRATILKVILRHPRVDAASGQRIVSGSSHIFFKITPTAIARSAHANSSRVHGIILEVLSQWPAA